MSGRVQVPSDVLRRAMAALDDSTPAWRELDALVAGADRLRRVEEAVGATLAGVTELADPAETLPVRVFRRRPGDPGLVLVQQPGTPPWVLTPAYARDLAALLQGAALTAEILPEDPR